MSAGDPAFGGAGSDDPSPGGAAPDRAVAVGPALDGPDPGGPDPGGPDPGGPDPGGAAAAGRDVRSPAGGGSSLAAAAAVLAVVAAAVNLRPAVVSLAPMLDDLRVDTGMSGATAGILTALAVLCFGAFAPAAEGLAARFGRERVLIAAVAILVPGLGLRALGGIPLLFATALVCGAAIAVANVLVPAVIRAGPVGWIGVSMGLYMVALNGGAAVAAATAVPLRDGIGGGWQGALALWAVPAAVATVFCAWAWRGRTGGAAVGPRSARRRLARHPVAWALPGFMALQCAQFYAASAWLPSVFVDGGLGEGTAGSLLAVMQLVGVASGLVVPVLAARAARQTSFTVLAVVLWGAGWAGMLAEPGAAPLLWMILMGLGQGAGISIALTLIVLRSADAAGATVLSVRTQTVGYLLGALGPFSFGLLHGVTDGWQAPIALMLAGLVPMLLLGLVVGRPGQAGTIGR